MYNYTRQALLPFQKFWSCLIDTGVTDKVHIDELKFVRFTNVVAALTAVATLIYMPLSLYQKNYLLVALQAVDMLCVLSVLFVNYLGYHKLASHVFLFVVNTFVLINACFIGYESKVQEFFYITYVVPFLLFRIKDYKNIIIGILTAVAFYNIYQHIYQNFTAYNVPLAQQIVINNINVWMKFVLFGIAIYVMAYYNYASETKLEISNKKLKEQTDELSRSNQDLEQFAYIISHDLKAPVRSIGSFMKLLLNRHQNTLPEDAREFISLSKTSAERLSRQIDDLLSYCKVGMNLPPVSSVNLNAMVKTIQLELDERIRESNARVIITRRLPGLQDVHSSMMHHVLQNLIANGIKFNTSENPYVSIDYKDSGDMLQFIVKDNGIGIHAGFEDKLFQMFQRLNTNEKFEGTGIGLAVCKKIVNFYNGTIWFESTPGEGTSFYFTLPKTLMAADLRKQPERGLMMNVSPGKVFAAA